MRLRLAIRITSIEGNSAIARSRERASDDNVGDEYLFNVPSRTDGRFR